MKYLFLILLSLIAFSGNAQTASNDPDYNKAVDIGLGELQKGQCMPCLEAYERAFSISRHSVLSHLRAALCAQMCTNADKARFFSDKALEINWKSTLSILQSEQDYPELNPFRQSALGKKMVAEALEKGRLNGINFEAESAEKKRVSDQPK